ncbi:MAG: mitochondrial fission ELM1 family protein [Hyphomicrobiaceae bacterium]
MLNATYHGSNRSKLTLSSKEGLLAAVRGRTGWIIGDGKAGHEAQCRGVFEALGLAYEVKRIRTGPLQRVLAPYVPVARTERFGAPGSNFAPPWPDFAIAAGRLTVPYIRALKQQAKRATFTIILQDPKVPLSTADLFWMPAHDPKRGANVVTTVVAPHGFSPARLAALRATAPPAAFAALPRPWVAVLVGGNGSSYRFTRADEMRLAAALRSIAALGASLLITPSRRTPPSLMTAIAEATADHPRFLWDGTGENPYPAMLAHADRFVVTADSINMCGEPTVTGRPIHFFTPSGGSAKFRRFHDALARHGATRPLPEQVTRLDDWRYAPLYAAADIALAVAERWQRRRAMLSSGSAT